MQHFLVSESCTGYYKSESAHFIEEIAPHPTLLGEEKTIPRSQNSFIFDYFDGLCRVDYGISIDFHHLWLCRKCIFNLRPSVENRFHLGNAQI